MLVIGRNLFHRLSQCEFRPTMGIFDPLFDASNVDSLPLSSGQAVTLLSAGYLIVMVITTLLAPKQPLQLRLASLVNFFLAVVRSFQRFQQVHNSLLCLYSLYSFIGFAMTLMHNFATSSSSALTLLFCDARHELLGGNMNFWMYHFYLSKVRGNIWNAILFDFEKIGFRVD